jgi:D-alanyl-lipoteichoic acid acyltransferase DltB (MBOAT superfamily)
MDRAIRSSNMLFNSYWFLLVFLPMTWGGFWVLRQQPSWARIWLVAASLLFYGCWNPTYVALLLASITGNYHLARFITARDRTGLPSRRHGLIVAIAGNVLLLGYFKYTSFFLAAVSGLTGTFFHVAEIVLPLGISFFTFTQIAFLVELYRGEATDLSFDRYLLFVTFFPHLIAGPILYYREIGRQLSDLYRRPFMENLSIGLTIAMIGLFKKVVLADNVAAFVNPVFEAADAGRHLSLTESWGGILAYALQLYFDFSGYSDMAIGLARMFGVTFPANFSSPYQATSIIEFWQRWHMTLSRFLRDFVYIPLGGNRQGPMRRDAHVMMTMLLCGLWHGAGWTYVAWGAWHGVLLIINRRWRSVCPYVPAGARLRRSARCIGAALTFLAVCGGWVLFRSPSFSAAYELYRGMMGLNGIMLPEQWQHKLGPVAPWLGQHGVSFGDLLSVFQGGQQVVWIVGLLLVVWVAPNTQDIMAACEPVLDGREVRKQPLQWWPSLSWAMTIALLALVSLLSLNQVTEFLYFQF